MTRKIKRALSVKKHRVATKKKKTITKHKEKRYLKNIQL